MQQATAKTSQPLPIVWIMGVQQPVPGSQVASRMAAEVPAASLTSGDDVRPAGSYQTCIKHQRYAPPQFQLPSRILFYCCIVRKLISNASHPPILVLVPNRLATAFYPHQ